MTAISRWAEAVAETVPRRARRAAWPLGLMLLPALWALSGLVIVPLDGRAVVERFGSPVSVLGPGLHAVPPWPIGSVRRVDFGPVRAVALGNEAAPPLLVADGRGVQAVTTAIRVLYRVGLTDAAARQAATGDAPPAALVQALAARASAAWFAAHDLPAALEADRASLGETLRHAIQASLDGARSGIEVLRVIVAAVAPAGAAADQPIRAAEMAAQAQVAAARGAAAALVAQARQSAFERMSGADAAAAETVAAARTVLVRFQADQSAAQAGGASFLLERYFAALQESLAHAPKTIIDHRLNWPEPPVLDLRPLAGAAASATGREE